MYVTHDGVELHWERVEGGPGTPALLVMGLGFDARAWERVVPRLARDRPLVLYDARGVGRSSSARAGRYGVDEHAGDALAVLDAAGLDRAHLVALSAGGLAAVRATRIEPTRVASLTLLACAARFPPRVFAVAARAAGRFALDVMRGGRGRAAERLARAWMPVLCPVDDDDTARATLADKIDDVLACSVRPTALPSELAELLRGDVTADLPSLDVPVLVVAGEQDRLVPIDLQRSLADALPRARFVAIPRAGHGLVVCAPVPVSEAVATFLAELDAT